MRCCFSLVRGKVERTRSLISTMINLDWFVLDIFEIKLMFQNLSPILNVSPNFIHGFTTQDCDLRDLHLIRRRQIYDQQFRDGRVILSNVYENLCCKSFLVVNVPITTAVILNIDLMLTYVMCVCKNNTYSSVNNVQQ